MHKRNKAKRQARAQELQRALRVGETSLEGLLEGESCRSCCEDSLWISLPSSSSSTNRVSSLLFRHEHQEKKSKKGDDDSEQVDWTTVPRDLDPAAGELSPIRTSRKRDQLSSLVCLVEEEIRCRKETNPTIVDFGAGSGHLGLLIAYRNPHTSVILVERKAYSIEVARGRIEKCQLDNVKIYLHDARDILSSGYIDHFEIGVSLHSCGLLTDFALELCLQSRASVVLSPCCYGQIAKPPPAFEDLKTEMPPSSLETQSEGIITIPKGLSVVSTAAWSKFHILLNGIDDKKLLEGSEDNITLLKCFQSVASGADFANNFDDEKAICLTEPFLLAKRCMRLIDYDRALSFLSSASKLGCRYAFRLTSLFPLSCSPKNDVIVGRFMSYADS